MSGIAAAQNAVRDLDTFLENKHHNHAGSQDNREQHASSTDGTT
jgi:hypothetical protein